MKKLSFTANLAKRNDTSCEPAWAGRIDRWYQLDEMGFAFCEALHEWNYLESFTLPDLILLGIEGASNWADQDFVGSGSQSPAKFVYTLPNISAAVIFQILRMHSKVYCLSKGQDTVNLALKEAEEFAKAGKKVWLFASPLSQTEADNSLSREIHFYSY